MSAARAAVDRYLHLINERRYDEIASIFAPDGLFLAPIGEEFRGREAIHGFYSAGLRVIAPAKVWASSAVAEGNVCVIEISAQLPGEEAGRTHTVVDHFTVDDAGLVTRMAVYLRPEEIANTRAVLGGA
ncbi:nuclear transport factor 2 family protein [Frankia canadensis]|nr:nuclear transport factor 2 family protein [Frankia canadensis]